MSRRAPGSSRDGARADRLFRSVYRSRPEHLTARSPRESADIINAILDGRPGPHRDIVVANAAAALVTAGAHGELKPAVAAAQQAIDSKAAFDKLGELVSWTKRHAE